MLRSSANNLIYILFTILGIFILFQFINILILLFRGLFFLLIHFWYIFLILFIIYYVYKKWNKKPGNKHSYTDKSGNNKTIEINNYKIK